VLRLGFLGDVTVKVATRPWVTKLLNSWEQVFFA
jgi:hypothetical protein